MKTTAEFYNWCDEQKKLAIQMCKGDLSLISRIEKEENPIAKDFESNSGSYIEAPGFRASVLFERAKSDDTYSKAMTRLQNDDTETLEDK